MVLTFDELRQIKHSLPTGSIAKIAQQLNIEEQTVRNFFGGDHYKDGKTADLHLQPGPGGGVVTIEDTRILELAREILASHS
ncbi:MAG: DNA-binding protein [Saprospiraceae bacterium]|jgi:hypothetical protein|nr:DNA-binding protein [Saprospiraceae bacterium]MBL0191696.1 DNA-binding protein [Saprospiraceae bacterium]MBL0293854.1 DNA-binding protein [Saprospiraceae bacterium]